MAQNEMEKTDGMAGKRSGGKKKVAKKAKKAKKATKAKKGGKKR
jgi:hypothetical protein